MRKALVYAVGAILGGLLSQAASASTVTDVVTGIILDPNPADITLTQNLTYFAFGGFPTPWTQGVNSWVGQFGNTPTDNQSSQTLFPHGRFAVDYQFDLTSAAALTSFVYQVPFLTEDDNLINPIRHLRLTLDSGSVSPGNPGTPIACSSGPCGYDPSEGQYNLTFANLSAGDYTLVVSGQLRGWLPGQFNGTATVSAVPLPGAMVLFGSAIAGLGGFGYLRRRKAS